MDKYEKAAKAGQEFLTKNPRDVMHDLAHHKSVWENCQKIVAAEHLRVDTDLLKVAAFWHDVVIGKVKWPSRLNVEETCKHLSQSLPQMNFTEHEIQKVIEIIKHHEFRDNPKSLEGLVLQDADKIDATSIERGLRALNAMKQGKIKKEIIDSYARTFLKWLPIITATFHFGYSKKVANRNIKDFMRNSKWNEVIKELGLWNEYVEAKKNISSPKTFLVRSLIYCKNLIFRLKIPAKSLLP